MSDEARNVGDVGMAELARVVAWLRTRAMILSAKAEFYAVAGDAVSHERCNAQRYGLTRAANDLEQGEQP